MRLPNAVGGIVAADTHGHSIPTQQINMSQPENLTQRHIGDIQNIAHRLLLPDFGLFSVGDTASAGAELSWALLGGLAMIAVGYMLLHLLTATWIFSKKEF